MAYNEKQKNYIMKYLEKLKEIRFRVQQEEYEKYEKAARSAGYPSMRQFYLDAINEKVEKLEVEGDRRNKINSGQAGKN